MPSGPDVARAALREARNPQQYQQQLATVPSTGSFDANDAAIVNYLGLNPNDPKSRAVVAVCQTYGLDPLLKHVIVIPKGGVYITRDGYLHIAHRSGQLNGIVVEEPPHLSEDGREWLCTVTVYRKDMHYGFTFPGRYPVNGQNRDYAPEMALKAAEAHGLRRAFNVTGLGAADERHQPDEYAEVEAEEQEAGDE
jgi:hypothetical protein